MKNVKSGSSPLSIDVSISIGMIEMTISSMIAVILDIVILDIVILDIVDIVNSIIPMSY